MVTEQVPINTKNFPCRAARQPPWARHHSWSPAPLQSPELRPGPGRSARLHPEVSSGLVGGVSTHPAELLAWLGEGGREPVAVVRRGGMQRCRAAAEPCDTLCAVSRAVQNAPLRGAFSLTLKECHTSQIFNVPAK